MKKKTVKKVKPIKKEKATTKLKAPRKKTVSAKTAKAAKKKTAPLITKDTIIGELVIEYPELVEVFFAYGLHCFGCSIAQFDTIEAGARAHGIHPEHLLKDLNAQVAKKKRSRA